MKENLLKLKEWWSTLASREKRLISVGGTAAALFIIYQWIWSPYVDFVGQMRARIQSQQKLLAWMQTADADIARLQSTAQPAAAAKTTPIVLLSIMQKQINQAGLSQSLSQLKQAGNDSVEIQFAQVDFDKMIDLLITTLKEQNVTITQMSVNADNALGIVKANVVLKIA